MKENVLYSDGTIEDRIIKYLREHNGVSTGIVHALPEGAVFHNFSAARENLLSWYPFTKDDIVLEIGAGMGAMTEKLAKICGKVVALEPSPKRAEIAALRCRNNKNVEVITQDISQYEVQTSFDYVLLIGVLEYAGITVLGDDPWGKMLAYAKRYLKKDGKLLLAIENKFGLKYWCGAAEDHTGIPFDSINNYEKSRGITTRYGQQTYGVRTFSKEELNRLLSNAGFCEQRYYYPFPDYKFPMLVLSDESDNLDLIGDVKFNYPEESFLIADQQKIYPEVAQNGGLPFFANSFLVEAGFEKKDDAGSAETVVMKRDYCPCYQISTVVSAETVTRYAANPEAEKHLNELVQNTEQLIERKIPCVLQSEVSNGMTSAERIRAPRADHVFAQAISENDSQLVFSMLEKLREYILRTSSLTEKGGQVVLKEAFLDLTFRNSFWMNNDLLFFDQEWKAEDIPLSFMLFRSINYTAATENALYRAVLQYCGLTEENMRQFKQDEQHFLNHLMDMDVCSWFDKTMYQDRLLYENKVQTQLKNKEAHIELLLQSERDLKHELEAKKEIVAAQDVVITEKEAQLEKSNALLHDRTFQLAEKETELKDKSSFIKEQTEALEEKNLQINGLQQELLDTSVFVEQLKSQISDAQQVICNKQGHIELLLESDRELERIKNSRSWRFMGYAWKIRDALIPKGSKRRLFGKMLVKFVKHPIRFLSKCTPHKISKFFKVLRREGVEGTSRRLDDCLLSNQIPEQRLVIQNVCEEAIAKTAAEYKPLHVPTWSNPCVSIVIPVYNQFDYTYACVKSILQNSENMTYEIIVADDCSTDVTTEIEKIITGLKTIHNQENLRFLRNCNNAAKYAKGKYILFLNNDTQVQENWLAPLVELMEKDATIGMTGSKLVYPDGRLQEAGGIFWKDASAWNYGNRSDPTAPEYNYVKDVDYISGASICIRKSLWEEIGGFDDRFAPAYCEDSDLAFQVRAHGFRVVYQPLSVVVHFEGVSNGTDTSSGQKAYQVVNQKKFYEKWKDTLEREHFLNGNNVFQARDRSRNKKTVVVVDHYIPTYDKDAGSRTVDQYLQLLVGMGYNVKLIGDNFYCNVPYARRIEQMGIEILYGVYYRDHWMDWVRENSAVIDFVFLNRPHITVKYIDYFRAQTNAKIIYYGHDLHFLREYREYKLTGDPELLKSSEKWKKQELDIMRKADVVFTLSVDEQSIINHELNQEKAIISPILYFNTFPDDPVCLRTRKNIIFVGGFGHHPNENGVLWFVNKMWQQIQAQLPDVKFIIIGSNPSEKITALESSSIHVTGYVTDDELEAYYQKSRLCVIPLRFGAGVKGKTIEAMYHRIPIVSTSIGTEGLLGIDSYLPATDQEDAFIQRVIDLYQDDVAAEREVEGYYDYLREHFSYEKAKRLFSHVFSKENTK